mgnify:CR=1 FL=1
MRAKKKNKKKDKKDIPDEDIDMLDKTLDIKNETNLKEDKPASLSQKEKDIFQKSFLSYSRNQINSINEEKKEEQNLKIYEDKANQQKNIDFPSINKIKNEPLGQLIDGREIDLNGNPILKKKDDDIIIYNGGLFFCILS